MKVSHYFEWEKYITGGHRQSVKNQRTIMDRRGINYTTSPDLDSDILHLNNMGPKSVRLARATRNTDTQVLIHTHLTAEDFRESFAFSNQLAKPMKPYLNYAYSLADHLVCPSEHNRNVIDTYTDVQKTVISNGFDPEKLTNLESKRQDCLERYNLTPPVVFMVGHVIKRKGLETFIETAHRMPELDFAWFGHITPISGSLGRIFTNRETEKLIKNSPDNCTFTGYVSDIRDAFAAGDIFFFPSRNENEGMALLEAMASGKPPVVRNLDVFEWLDANETCLKSDNGFVMALDELKDTDMRRRLGRNARKKSQEYRVEKVGDDLERLYRSLV